MGMKNHTNIVRQVKVQNVTSAFKRPESFTETFDPLYNDGADVPN